jgi:tetratricopeptide (TPR) repeat protein
MLAVASAQITRNPDTVNCMKDFFISYNKADKAWAEWIAYILEAEGYTVVIQAWDFRPGGNFVLEMQKAASGTGKTVVVLSPNYLTAEFTQPEWAGAFARDPQGKNRTVVPFRVKACTPEGILGPIIYVDLVGLSNEHDARAAVLDAFASRAKPTEPPAFPGKQAQTNQSRTLLNAVPFPGTWNVPLPRNPFFTGREDKLKEIEDGLSASGIVALTGIGGTGKTQVAAEYAYRHRDQYSAVLWTSALSRETLVSDFTSLAKLLGLPLKDEADQSIVVDALKRWLTVNSEWLLILDNADDLAIVHEFVPAPNQGHVLFTTQVQATGAVQGVPITDMLPDDGALLLLRRAKKINADDPLGAASEPDRTAASQISVELGGLPLALDQAGAYVEETGCRLEDYLKLYRRRHDDLLRRRGSAGPNHPNSVATTFAISFEKVERENEAAADLLRLSAFLYPDEIPEEILESGASELGPILGPVARDQLRLNAAFAEALKYSLVKRDPDAMTLQIHRLVQVVLKNGMDESTKKVWAERAIKVTYLAFPEWEGVNKWAKYKRWLPQAFACADLAAEQKLKSGELAWVINQAASYLLERGIYQHVGPLCRMAVRIWEEVYGPANLDVAAGLNNLAGFYHVTGEHARAEPIYKRALAIKQRALGPGHPDVASGLKSLASLYREQGKYAEAEPLFQQALTIREKALGPEHPDVAASLNGLAVLLSDQGRYAEAEPLYQRALAIRETALGKLHPDVAMTLSNMAVVFGLQGRHTEAEALLNRALAISEAAVGANHPDVATCLSNLAKLYMEQGYHSKAEPYLQRALEIRTNSLGPEHPGVAAVLKNYSMLLREQKRITAAKEMEGRARAILEAHAKRNRSQ